MRTTTRHAVVVAIATWVTATAQPATANGGAYIEVEGTHHLVGSQARATLSVSVPRRHRDLLDRGPFIAYLLPRAGAIGEGRGLPAGAVALGTFDVARTAGGAELSIAFTVPDVEGDYYQLGMCNQPCTIAGFGESVSGTLSVVATAREAALLTEVARTHARAAGLRRDLRKVTSAAEDEAAATAATLTTSEARVTELTAEVAALDDRLASARAEADEAAGRVDLWVAVLVALGALTAAGGLAVLVGRRRAPRRPAATPAGAQPSP